jgi:hypothetical protein
MSAPDQIAALVLKSPVVRYASDIVGVVGGAFVWALSSVEYDTLVSRIGMTAGAIVTVAAAIKVVCGFPEWWRRWRSGQATRKLDREKGRDDSWT